MALAALGVMPNTPAANDISLGTPIAVEDANGQTTYQAFNFSSPTLGVGYVTVADHTRVPLVGVIVHGVQLASTGETVDLGSGGVFQSEPDGSFAEIVDAKSRAAAEPRGIAAADFLTRQKAAVARQLQSNRQKLHQVEIETEIQLNALASLLSVDPAEAMTGTWAGQDTNGDYGGIWSPTAYLASRYGGTWSLSSQKILSVENFRMTDIGPNDGSNCAPTAITRAFAYARSQGFTRIIASDNSLYGEVRSVAAANGWTSSGGMSIYNIDNVIRGVGTYYGYPNTSSKEILIWSYSGTIQSDINQLRPLLWNIQSSGYYGKHTVTVNGWATYTSSTGRTAPPWCH